MDLDILHTITAIRHSQQPSTPPEVTASASIEWLQSQRSWNRDSLYYDIYNTCLEPALA